MFETIVPIVLASSARTLYEVNYLSYQDIIYHDVIIVRDVIIVHNIIIMHDVIIM